MYFDSFSVFQFHKTQCNYKKNNSQFPYLSVNKTSYSPSYRQKNWVASASPRRANVGIQSQIQLTVDRTCLRQELRSWRGEAPDSTPGPNKIAWNTIGKFY